jgi:hypothetical protein
MTFLLCVALPCDDNEAGQNASSLYWEFALFKILGVAYFNSKSTNLKRDTFSYSVLDSLSN